MDFASILYKIKNFFFPHQIKDYLASYAVKNAFPRSKQTATIGYKKNIGEARFGYAEHRIPKKKIVKAIFFRIFAQNPSLLIKTSAFHSRKMACNCYISQLKRRFRGFIQRKHVNKQFRPARRFPMVCGIPARNKNFNYGLTIPKKLQIFLYLLE